MHLHIDRRPPPIEEVVQRMKARIDRDGIRIENIPSSASLPQRPETTVGASVPCAPAICPPNRSLGTRRRATAKLTCLSWLRASRMTAT